MICNFYLSVAARKIVLTDPSLRYTSMLLGRYATNQQTSLLLLFPFLYFPFRTQGISRLVRFFCCRDCIATAQIITVRLQVTELAEEGYGKHAGEWAGEAEKQVTKIKRR